MRITDSLQGRISPVADQPVYPGSRSIVGSLRTLRTPLFRRIVESSASCVMVVDTAPDHQPIVYASPALEKLIGYSAAELLGADWELVLNRRADGAPPGAVRAALRRGSAVREILRARRGDRSTLFVDVRFAPLCGGPGVAALRVAFLNNVTADFCARETLEYRACHDPLTGLANRYLLQDRFDRAAFQTQRHGGGFTLVLLDLDRFKQINDRLGHRAGDAVLRAVGARLERLVRGEDTVARWGGDEFVMILTQTEGAEAIQITLGRIQTALIHWDGGGGTEDFEVHCSAGVATYPGDGATLEALLERADQRLYSEKG